MSTGDDQPSNRKPVLVTAFLPTLLFSVGEGAVIPALPLLATDLGADLAGASAVAAMILIGQLIGDLPAGWLVTVIGERNAMMGAGTVAAAGASVFILFPSLGGLTVSVFLIGLCASVFGVGRHAFLTTHVAIPYRGRVMSTLGGVLRVGWFTGPLIAAWLLGAGLGDASLFWVCVLLCLASVVVLGLLAGPGQRAEEGQSQGALTPTMAGPPSILGAISASRGMLFRVGVGVAAVSAIRVARTILLPLWAVALGVQDAAALSIIGLAGAIELGLFFVAGYVMDRFGRIWSVIPTILGLSTGYMALALIQPQSHAFVLFIAASIWLGVVNGMGSGIVMTLGADLAPKRHPAPFLSAWRLIGDLGSASSPMVIASLTALASLQIATIGISVFGLVGAGVLMRYLPRYL